MSSAQAEESTSASTRMVGPNPVPWHDRQASLSQLDVKDIARIHNVVVYYAQEKGLTETEFAERVRWSVTNIEALAYAAEKSGGSAKEALDALSNFSAFIEELAPRIAADDFPRYDAEGKCRKAHDAITQKMSINYCIEHEQAGYDRLLSIWNDLTQEEKVKCTSLIRRGNYMAYYMSANWCDNYYLPRKERERLMAPHHFRE
jgi:hypothetical protein